MKLDQLEDVYITCDKEDKHRALELIIHHIDEESLKHIFQMCKKRNSLTNLIRSMDSDKMAKFFIDCKNKKDYSSLHVILK